jgi:glycosyltransferase involved in cell wall biosynthesis
VRVLFVGAKGLPSKSGAERVVEGIVKELHDKHDLTILCNSEYTKEGTTYPGVDLIRIPVPKGKHIQPFAYFFKSAIFALVNKRKYDVVHVHNVEACFVLPLLKLRYKVISTSHGSAYDRDKWGKGTKLLLKLTELPFIYLSNIITSVSKPLAHQYEDKYSKSIKYIPNGVDVEPLVDEQSAIATLRKNGAPDSGYLLFAAGRIDPTKGCHVFLEALQGLPDGVHAVVVGDTKHAKGYDEKLKAMAGKRVTFISFIDSKPELLGIIKRCKLFVFPSMVEAMSMMLLEVASLGVPVVWSDIPENVAVMPENTVSFKSEDVADLKSKIEWAMENEEYNNKLALETKTYVNTEFSWSEIAGAYDRLYLEIVNPKTKEYEKNQPVSKRMEPSEDIKYANIDT